MLLHCEKLFIQPNISIQIHYGYIVGRKQNIQNYID